MSRADMIEREATMIDIQWADEARSRIHIRLERGWSAYDLRQAVEIVDSMIGSVSHTVDLWIDIRRAGGLPRDFLQLAGDLLGGGDPRPNQGQTCILGANWVLKSAYQAVQRLYGAEMQKRPLRFVDEADGTLVI
jgi:hypothetical protein